MATITFAVAVVWAVVMSTRYVFVSPYCAKTTSGVKSHKLEISQTSITPVTGGSVDFTCSIELEPGAGDRLKPMLFHIWLYAPHLKMRMAAFHPQKPPNPPDPDPSQSFGNVTRRVFIDHPEGPRCGQYGPVSCQDQAQAARANKYGSRWKMVSFSPVTGNDSYMFSVTVRNTNPVCCDNGEYYCWFFIYDYRNPCKGFNSRPVNLNVTCHHMIIARGSDLCYTPIAQQQAAHNDIWNAIQARQAG